MPTPPTGADKPHDVGEVCDALWWTMSLLQDASRTTERRLGVTGAQLLLLNQLETASRLSIRALADRTRTDQSTVSVIVARLVRRRLAKKSRARDDARRAEVALTATGARVLRSAREMLSKPVHDAVGRLEPSDRESLTRGLAALLAALDTGDGRRLAPIAVADGHHRGVPHA